MNKVGIITLNGYNNYGNRLQNYALQSYIEKQGFDVETILIENEITFKGYMYKFYKKLIDLKNINKNKSNDNLQKFREEKFRIFSTKYIKETNYTIKKTSKSYEKLNDFNYFIVGSDQVWNPQYIGNNELYFLTFAPKHKRIAYAPSFGTAVLPKEFEKNYSIWLSELNHISVREKAGSNIIKELTGRDVPVVIDPTLLITKKEWLEITKSSEYKPKKPFILTYFLGGIKENDYNEIKKMAEERNYEIIELANILNKDIYSADPSEFLDFINSSELFLTDSFHGVIFSLIFKKPFLVFQRNSKNASMYSRIDTLLNTFNVGNRKWENVDNVNDLYRVDFSGLDKILEKERLKSKEFLNTALNKR